jgi:nucleoside-diphosphate-sugar epimerase
MLAMDTDEGIGQTFNIAASSPVTLNSLVGHLKRSAASEAAVSYAAPRPGDIRHSYADISKARDLLGFSPRVSFASGLQQTMEWFRQGVRETADL